MRTGARWCGPPAECRLCVVGVVYELPEHFSFNNTAIIPYLFQFLFFLLLFLFSKEKVGIRYKKYRS